MSAATEALARVLDPWAFESARRHSARAMATATATRILRDPGPLLDALPDDVLVEALVQRGVLEVEYVGAYRPHPRRRRYTTEWQEDDRW